MKAPDCSLAPIVLYDQIKRPVHWREQFGREAPLEVEIGFGMGEFLIRTAKENPHRDYVGIEQIWERIHKTLSVVTKEQKAAGQGSYLRNIRILKVDARVAFERLFAEETIDRIHCLFPCPWPKKGHIKHRLFSSDFLKILNNRLKKDGTIKIITDFRPFVGWILGEVPGSGFEVRERTVGPRHGTKFERKWCGEGQKEFVELNLMKQTHLKSCEKEDIALRSYTVDYFNPQTFRFRDEKGAVSVILKDMIFDGEQNRAMIHLVVAEQSLTQHFWVAVMKREKFWRVCTADGQNFLPTPGIARALELVDEAARQSRVAPASR